MAIELEPLVEAQILFLMRKHEIPITIKNKMTALIREVEKRHFDAASANLRVCRPWTEQEKARLFVMSAYASAREIAEELDRSESSVYSAQHTYNTGNVKNFTNTIYDEYTGHKPRCKRERIGYTYYMHQQGFSDEQMCRKLEVRPQTLAGYKRVLGI